MEIKRIDKEDIVVVHKGDCQELFCYMNKTSTRGNRMINIGKISTHNAAGINAFEPNNSESYAMGVEDLIAIIKLVKKFKEKEIE